MVQPAPDGAAADAYLLSGSRGIYLRRAGDVGRGDEPTPAEAAAGEATGANDFPSDAFGPFEADGSAGSKLDKALDAMAKAINIRRLAESGESMIIGDPDALGR